jgi:hypothetical protein
MKIISYYCRPSQTSCVYYDVTYVFGNESARRIMWLWAERCEMNYELRLQLTYR